MDRTSVRNTTIRDMKPADAECIAGFVTALTRFEAKISADRDPSEQAGRDQFEYLCGEIESLDGFCLVAELDGQLLGFLMAAPQSLPGSYVKPEYRTYGEIFDLYVEPEARGSGLARKLVDVATERFREMGFRQIGLYTLAGNEEAVRVYKRMGFEHYEVFMRKDISD